MRSPVLQKSIVSDIIKSCTAVGAVAFWESQSDWDSTVGLIDGTVQEFQCVSFGRESNKPAWGQSHCL